MHHLGHILIKRHTEQ